MSIGLVFDNFTQFQQQIGGGGNFVNKIDNSWGPGLLGTSMRGLEVNPGSNAIIDNSQINISGGPSIVKLIYNYGTVIDFRNIEISTRIRGSLIVSPFASMTLRDVNGGFQTLTPSRVNSTLIWRTSDFTNVNLSQITFLEILFEVIPSQGLSTIVDPISSIIIPSGGFSGFSTICGY